MTRSANGKRFTAGDRWLLMFASLFVGFMTISTILGRIPWLLLGGYVAMSCATFLVYAWDKSAAQQGRWRTPESTLHLLGFVGGWPGALAAQRLLRHKSRKQEFLLVFWLTVIVNTAGICLLVWSGLAGVTHD